MSEQNTNAQLEAYRTLVDDFKRFVSSEIRAEENSYRIVDMTSEDAEIDDPSVPVTQLEDEKAEKLAGICMDLSNATLWLYYNRDKFANVEFMPLTDETLKEYQKQAQNALNEPKSPLYLKSWYITMAIFNTNEFLRKTFSKTIFGTAALRPEAVCADGFTLSIQASGMHYCIPNEDLSDGNYSKVELSYLSEEVEEFLPFAEDDEAPLATVYGYVPVETVDAVLAKHGGIVNA